MRTRTIRICVASSCQKGLFSEMFCNKYHTQHHRYPPTRQNTRAVGNTPKERFLSLVSEPDENGCHLWRAGINHTGYGVVNIEGKARLAHRMAFYYANGFHATLCVLHSCDVRSCVNPEHLREGSRQENMDDMVRRHRSAKGEMAGNSKLTASDVIQIRELYAKGNMTQREIGSLFGITVANVSAIVLYKSWRVTD